MQLPFNDFQIIFVLFVSLAGAVLQSGIGFGLGPLCVPLLILIDTHFVPAPLLLASFVLNILIFLKNHDEIILREFGWALSGRVVGTGLGTIILLIIPRPYLAILFASMVLLAVGISVAGRRLAINLKNLIGAGILSGIMGTTAAIGGAPMALLYQHSSGPKLRGTLSSVFLFGILLALISLFAIGRFGLPELKLAVLLLPGILLGFFLSRFLVPYLDRGLLRPVILGVAGISAVIILIKVAF